MDWQEYGQIEYILSKHLLKKYNLNKELSYSFTIDGDCCEKRDYKEIVLRIKRRLP